MSITEIEFDSTVRIPSFGALTESDLNLLDLQLKREREWYSTEERYSTNHDIEQAIDSGSLILLETTEDIRPIERFRDRRDVFVPAVTPNAMIMRNDFAKLWRFVLNESGITCPDVRLAETSMVRSEEYQAELIERARLASPDSTHCTGNAIDYDNAGYYVLSNGKVQSVGDPRRKYQQFITTEAHKQQMCSRDYRYDFDKRITEAALTAAQLLHKEGVLNLVNEFSGTANACLHLAAHPHYETPDSVARLS